MKDLACDDPNFCELQCGVVVPLVADGAIVGVLAALDATAPAGLLRLCSEVAQFVSTQLELAELDRSRQRAVQAELRFLRGADLSALHLQRVDGHRVVRALRSRSGP